MDAIFVVNPRAGRGRGAHIARELPDLAKRHGLTAHVRSTSGPRDAERLAREAANDAPLVVAVGGDGTAHEVVNGLAETSATFGLIPFGTGNDLALALGIPSDVPSALDVLVTGRTTRIDLGRFDDHWFANSLGLGFEAQVTIESLRVQRLRGFAVYLWATLRALGKLRCPHYRIRVDDTTIDGEHLLVCVGNGPRVGGGFYLTPDAYNQDALFDVCLVEGMGRLRVLATLPKALDGSHVNARGITILRGKTIEIECEAGFPFHADGEVMDTRRRALTIELHAAALPVRVSTPKTESRGTE
jgi:YegS/Rv2252/BmrU family lipid kinase